MRRVSQAGLIAVGGLLGAAAIVAIVLPVGGALIAAMDRAPGTPPPAASPPAATAPKPAPRPHRAPVHVAASAPAPVLTPAPRSDTTLANLHIVRELQIPHWLRPGQFVWNDDGVPPGDMIVVVNIRARVLSVYRGGIEIGRSSLIYGADTKPTPIGTFPILQKDADHWSSTYDAPMPHMLRLTRDGVALHGSRGLADDAATHGCVGLPPEFAGLLFDVMKVGDPVIVARGENGG
jgi:hypothetical protein